MAMICPIQYNPLGTLAALGPALYFGRLRVCAVAGVGVSSRQMIDMAKKAHRQNIAAEAE